ncbi:hypothetical protein TNCV_4079501 [Trichonephila clavipes]|nr:hypothetical protein TNCV_4079501 [Trichonephila clavipes]
MLCYIVICDPSLAIVQQCIRKHRHSQAVKSSKTSSSTQTDENIAKIKCPPLKLLQPASSISKQNKTASISTSSAFTQAHLLPSTSTISESQPPIPKILISNDVYAIRYSQESTNCEIGV